MPKKADKPASQRIAMERIRRLFSQAEESFSKDPERAHKYMGMTRKLAMRYNVRLPASMKRRICKGCGRYLVPGKNCRIRVSPNRKAVVTTCMECGHVYRHPHKGKPL